jgi:hypothetical protein
MRRVSSPHLGAIVLKRLESGDVRSLIASHRTSPFLYELADRPGSRSAELHAIAHDYLDSLGELVGDESLGGTVRRPAGDKAEEGGLDGRFDWLPLRTERERGELGAFVSRLLRPREAAGDELTAIVVAGEALWLDGEYLPLNSGLGRRVVMHIRKGPDESWTAAVAGLTAHDRRHEVTWFERAAELFGGGAGLVNLGPQVFEAAGEQLGLEVPADTLWWRLRPVPSGAHRDHPRLIWTAEGVDRLSPKLPRVPYSFHADFIVESTDKGPGIRLLAATREPLASHASNRRVFRQDPASWRNFGLPATVLAPDFPKPPPADDQPLAGRLRGPGRSEKQLDWFRGDGAAPDALETNDFRILTCPAFARDDGADLYGAVPPPKVKNVPAAASQTIRSDSNSAVAAYYAHREIYALLDEFGLDLDDMFAATQRRIDVHYRSGTSRGPGKDGMTINAEVMLVPEKARPPRVNVHLALADLSHRTVCTGGGHPHHGDLRWPEHMGIANARRLVWHEFGHVVIAAVTGRLEFSFAHSAGDAMAAIWADPWSRLADPRGTDLPEGVSPALRGLTFPWLGFTRRHDRDPRLGWSWSGRFYNPPPPGAELPIHKGYHAEQILSSTLFRLYRVLGGDTIDPATGGPDYRTRRTASKVTLYLIVRGIEILTALHHHALELATAMMDADDKALSLHVGVPGDVDITHLWPGGMAQKAVRWAFEAQGMSIASSPPDPTKPEVDLYFADGRIDQNEIGETGGRRGDGGYDPVSLDWQGTPRWFATSWEHKNRLPDDPASVRRRAWIGIAVGDRTAAGWDRSKDAIRWVGAVRVFADGQLDAKIAALRAASAVPPGVDPASAAWFALAEVSADEDLANTDPASALPVAVAHGDFPLAGLVDITPRHLADLVASDNNLGIRWLP